MFLGAQAGAMAVLGTQAGAMAVLGTQAGVMAVLGTQAGVMAVLGTQAGAMAVLGAQAGVMAVGRQPRRSGQRHRAENQQLWFPGLRTSRQSQRRHPTAIPGSSAFGLSR